MRVCAEPECPTILSTCNPGDHCFLHTPDLSQPGAPDHVRPERRSRVWLNGLHDLSDEERAAYREEWA